MRQQAKPAPRSCRQWSLKPGYHEGRKPYGFREGEQAILARLKELYAADPNYEHVSRTLNAEGLRTRSGGQWYPATVRRIVKAA